MCLIVVVKWTFRLDLTIVKGIVEESELIILVCESLCEVVFATKMNVFVHFMRGLLEPAVWQLLQWIWSMEAHDIDEHSATQRLQFYRYSATSVLLFIFETIPHSVLLWLLAIGSLTVFGLFLAAVFCSCRITYYAVFRLIVKFVIWNLVKFLFACMRHTGVGIYQLILRVYIILARFLRSPRYSPVHNALEHIAPLAITSDNLTNALTNIIDSPVESTNHIAPISAEAFRPRRRRSRRIRTSNRTHSTETA